MLVAIRTDASTVIGLGHLQRCLALAHALRERGSQAIFVTRDLGLDSAERVVAAGFTVHTLQRPSIAKSVEGGSPAHAGWAQVSWQDDAQEFAHALGTAHADWVVVDHYAFDARWHQRAATILGSRVAVIDDLADRSLACDLVIDHTFSADHRRKYASCVRPGTTILGGPAFALLGPTYATAPRHRCRDSIDSVGIFMGGTDVGCHSGLALKACREGAGFAGEVEIVTSRSNPGLGKLEALVREDPSSRLLIDLPELSSFFARHDLQIGAGGGATWERCCMAAPSLSMVVAENQRSVLEPLRDLGVLRIAEPTEFSIAQNVRELAADATARCRMATRAGELVDGRGAARVAQHMMSA